jgi:hypothetical protein
MNLTQLIVGAAVGVLLAEGARYGIKHLFGWLQRDELRTHTRKLDPLSGHPLVHALFKYVALAGAVAAFVTLGVWATGDYFATRSARGAAASDVGTPAPAPVSGAPGSPTTAAQLASAPKADGAATPAPASADPYTDPEFKVQRPRAARLSLKDTLVKRAEAKARKELLSEMKQHQNRSQYDCEAADRAARYLKAGLDVWGFTAWQVKHFPMETYDGATLPLCQKIKEVVDPSRFDMHDAVAQGNDRGRAVRANEADKSRR